MKTLIFCSIGILCVMTSLPLYAVLLNAGAPPVRTAFGLAALVFALTYSCALLLWRK